MDFTFLATSTAHSFTHLFSSVGRHPTGPHAEPLNEMEAANLLLIMVSVFPENPSQGNQDNVVANAISALKQFFQSVAIPVKANVVNRNTHTKADRSTLSCWSAAVVGRVLSEHGLNWHLVLRNFCSNTGPENFSPRAYEWMGDVLKNADVALPVSALTSTIYPYPLRQLGLITYFASQPVRVVNFASDTRLNIVPPLEASSPYSSASHNNISRVVDIFHLLFQITDAKGTYTEQSVFSLLTTIADQQPYYALLSIVSTLAIDRQDADPLASDKYALRTRVVFNLLTKLFFSKSEPLSIHPHPAHAEVIARLYKLSPTFVPIYFSVVHSGVLARNVPATENKYATWTASALTIYSLVSSQENWISGFFQYPLPDLSLDLLVFFTQLPMDQYASANIIPDTSNWNLDLQQWLMAVLRGAGPWNLSQERVRKFFHTCSSYLGRAMERMKAETGAESGASARNRRDLLAMGISADGSETLATELKLRHAYMSVSLRTLVSFFRTLDAAEEFAQVPDNETNLKAIRASFAQIYPNLNAMIDHQVESLADTMFERVFSKAISVDDFVSLLEELQAGSNAEDKEVFNCIMRSLIEEYRYFAKYANVPITIMGQIYGTIISRGVVSRTVQFVMLREILETLKQDPFASESAGRFYTFGVYALEKMQSVLDQHVNYCQSLCNIPHFRNHFPQFVQNLQAFVKTPKVEALKEKVKEPYPFSKELKQLNLPPEPSGAFARKDAAYGHAMAGQRVVLTPAAALRQKIEHNDGEFALEILNALIPGGVLKSILGKFSLDPSTAAVTGGTRTDAAANRTGESSVSSKPPGEVINKITVYMNNLSQSTAHFRAEEVKRILQPEWYQWMAQQEIIKRAMSQVGIQNTLTAFLEAMNKPELLQAVIQSSVENVNEILRKPKLTASMERNHLANLGSWLGKLLLGRNKPLLHDDIALKQVITDAYESGKLQPVVRFTARFLQEAATSIVFAPPNPWTMAILSLLKELHVIPSLNQDIKNDIDTLFDTLNVSYDDVPVTYELMSVFQPELQDNPDFVPSMKREYVPGIPCGTFSRQDILRRKSIVPTVPALTSFVSLQSFSAIFHPQTAQRAVVDGSQDSAESDESFYHKTSLRNLVIVAVENTLKKMIENFACTTISIIATACKELVLKDFAGTEKVDTVLSMAKRLLNETIRPYTSTTIISSIKMEMRREISELIATHMYFVSSLPADFKSLGETNFNAAINETVDENLNIACVLVETIVVTLAYRYLEKVLKEEMEARNKAIASQPQNVPRHHSVFGNIPYASWMDNFPEALLPNPLRSLERYTTFLKGGSVAPNPPDTVASGRGAAPPPTTVPGPTFTSSMITESHIQGALATLLKYIESITPIAQSIAEQVRNVEDERVLVNSVRNSHVFSQLQMDILSFLQTLQQPLVHIVIQDPIMMFICTILDPRTSHNAVQKIVTIMALQILELFRSYSRDIGRDVMLFIQNLPISHLHEGVEGIIRLVNARLISLPDFDTYLVKIISDVEPSIRTVRNHFGQMDYHIWWKFAAEVVSSIQSFNQLNPEQNFPRTIALLNAETPLLLRPPLLKLLKEFGLPPVPKTRNEYKVDPAPLYPNNLITSLFSHTPNSPITSMQLSIVTSKLAKEDAYSNDVRYKVLYLLERWVRICIESNTGPSGDKQYQDYVNTLSQHGVLSSDSSLERFFLVMMDLCVQSCDATSSPYPESKQVPVSVLSVPKEDIFSLPVPTPRLKFTYTGVDALSKLVLVLLKVTDGTQGRISLLQKLMKFFYYSLSRDSKIYGGGGIAHIIPISALPPDAKFDPRPFLRLFTNILRESHLPVTPIVASGDYSTVTEQLRYNFQVEAIFANLLIACQPSIIPGFAFAWLQLVSHRLLLPNLLSFHYIGGWQFVYKLLVALLRFLYPFLRRGEMNEGLRLFYKGSLRLFLSIYHDFPGFLSAFAHALLEYVPPNATQLANIILAATPTLVEQPDCSDINAHVANAPEIGIPPRMFGISDTGMPSQMVQLIDSARFPRTKAQESPISNQALQDICEKLMPFFVSGIEEYECTFSYYSLRTVQAFVRLITTTVTSLLTSTTNTDALISPQSIETVTLSHSLVRIYYYLLEIAPEPLRFLLLQAGVSHLRYPNTHSYIWYVVLLQLYNNLVKADKESPTLDNLTRALLERLLPDGPAPWTAKVLCRDLLLLPVETSLRTKLPSILPVVSLSTLPPFKAISDDEAILERLRKHIQCAALIA